MNRIRLYWILQILGWGAVGFIKIFFGTLSSGITSVVVWAFIVLSAFYLISTHFLRYIIKTYDWFKLPFSKLLGLTLISILGMSFVNFVAQILISVAFNTLNPEEDFRVLIILASLFESFLFYALWCLVYFLFHFLDNYNTSLKYEARINEIRLNHLKSQLNPHFIFNALNSVRALVDEDPVKAKTAITRISNMLRFSLMMDKNQTISFEEELNTVKDYLSLESIRFEERLKVVYDIEDEAYDYKVPPMMLQTIVENAIKHGISNFVRGGVIEIKCKEGVGEELYMQVKNTGVLENEPNLQVKGEKGHGLSNTVERLKLIYGENATFRIFDSGQEQVITEIKIPKRIKSSQSNKYS
ncbi:sensor histidine kinase [Algoriphagus sediminis]|uniref:Histidine kinase n=1 Tax=Algoriphagus sediminis TaxID=3057113 RepID=A0ABT7YCH9_9BACT|nr:histidine kinase [Algoriphagus sediminis]MDN3204192.1 histidine kinase [Algoriphagus sediminis]